MQTATEWLVKKIFNEIIDNEFINNLSIEKTHLCRNYIEQAKEMEKQQMQYFGARCCLMTKQKNQWSLEELYSQIYDNNKIK